MDRQIRTDLAVESMELLKKEAPGVEKQQYSKENVQAKSQYGGKDIEVEFYLMIN